MPPNASRIVFLLLCAVAAFLFWQQYEKIYGDQGRLKVAQVDNTVWLSWHHEVDVPMATRFREAFYEWQNKTEKFVIDLNSPGGSLYEGGQVIELITEIKKTHTVETHVGPENICLSMCVPIFLQGDERRASAASAWMFHEPRSADFFTGEEVAEPEFERKYVSNRFFQKYFTNSPMAPSWREKLESEWEGKDIWRTGQQLTIENSNIITNLY